jgi:DNA-binding transcriptional LysR family regulator
MQVPELRLVRYWVAVAEERNITRAAERLHISQPALSAAIKQLEAQLGVALLDRSDRVLGVTPAGELLADEGRGLLASAERVAALVRDRDRSAVGRLRIGLTPTARYGLGPELLAACADRAPGVMLYPAEDTTGALLRDVAAGRLDLAVTFCAPEPPPAGVELALVRDEPAVVHLPAGHPLAPREALSLGDLASETILVAASRESGGFTGRVLTAFADAGVTPRTAVDPYPDLGLQAVREGVGIVVYVRSAYPPGLEGSVFVALAPPVTLPFHLAWRSGARGRALDAVLAAARAL